MTLKPNETLFNGQYRIDRQIGRGGFGFVYLAYDTLLEEQVAIKELIPALVGDEIVLKRFLAEAKATMRLRHKRIVATYNVFHEGENYYIVMEYMPGGSLEERLRAGGPLPADEAVRIAAQVCEGLACAHESGIVHCDLKPANVLFAADPLKGTGGSAKVADFGIAHISDQTLSRSWITPAGFVAGTLPYMSPEQTDGVRDDPRVDVYALGAVLYRMLTGETYIEFDQRDTPRAQVTNVERICGESPAPPGRKNPAVPAWLDGVVMRALAKRPEDRFESATSLRAALIEPQPAPARPPEPAPTATVAQPKRLPSPAATPTPRRTGLPPWFWAVAGAAGVLFVALVIAIILLAGGGGQKGGPTAEPSQVALATQAPRPSATSGAKVTEPAPVALPTAVPALALRVGMVTDFGGVNDASFNQSTWAGLQRAQQELGVQAEFIESQTEADYEKNIAQFAEQKYDLIVPVGFLLIDATKKMAEQYPNQKLAMVDGSYDPPIPNVKGIIFNVDEAAFPAGYLAAAWASLKDPADPQVGYVAGIQIPPVEQFITAYEAGVQYYNEKKGANVRVKGVYVGDFQAADQGKVQGNALIDDGVDVIFGCGAETGNGGLAAARERGKWGIGVDVDQYYALPNEKTILLTSVMKRMDNAVFAVVQELVDGKFQGGTNYIGTAQNGGVGLAPFHDFDSQIPAELKKELEEIQKGIVAGTIKTGWPKE